jgi:hypothetical protein
MYHTILVQSGSIRTQLDVIVISDTLTLYFYFYFVGIKYALEIDRQHHIHIKNNPLAML